MRQAEATLSGWGRATASRMQAGWPVHADEAAEAMLAGPHSGGTVFRGAGRSYGDCALNRDGAALLTEKLDHILAFDEKSGTLTVEPGVDFRTLLREFLPLGFLAPVTPGTGFATIGGAIAHDVHGKNHETAGTFAQHVTEISLLLPDGTRQAVQPGSALFRATAGGLGLTGLITRVSFRMRRVPGNAVLVRERRVADLQAFLAAMAEASGATYAVGWIDGTARGSGLGRGILETAEPDAVDLGDTRHAMRVPFDFPGLALNPISVRAFNAVYYRHVPKAGRERRVHYRRFLYPLDTLHDWNRIYGRRGFHQFQCVVPFAQGEHALQELLEVIAKSGKASFLAVLKRLGEGRAGFLSFPQPGYTLALDFPAGSGIENLYAQLCAIVLRFGGRVYLAKDALLDAGTFRRMYPQFPEFRAVLQQVDPNAAIQSDMARRLNLHG